MTVRFPAPLRTGDRIGVTAPSAGVPAPLRKRFDHCLRWLEERGYDVVVGECLDGSGVVSAAPRARARELTAMLTDPSIRAIVPPWGGELAIEILPHLDWAAITAAEPTWLVGYSDLATVLLSVTTRCGVATLHGQNLMEAPYELPEEIAHWTTVLEGAGTIEQRASTHHRSAAAGHDDWAADPAASTYTLDEAGSWRVLDGEPLDVTGTLIGGCAEVLGPLAGTPYGDVRAFAEQHAPDGLIVYVEAAEDPALNIARHLWSMRLAGWFHQANAVLIGRTHAPASDGFTQDDAVRSALADLGIPVVLDVDCGHVVPQLAFVNGATARLVIDGSTQSITQALG